MEHVVWQTLLYDFYGELLTEHRRRVYEVVVLDDISYSEAAETLGVSRQGVHDLVKRCNAILEEYERKLQLVKRFLSIREKAEKICSLSGGNTPPLQEIGNLAREILEEL